MLWNMKKKSTSYTFLYNQNDILSNLKFTLEWIPFESKAPGNNVFIEIYPICSWCYMCDLFQFLNGNYVQNVDTVLYSIFTVLSKKKCQHIKLYCLYFSFSKIKFLTEDEDS